jgi:DNA-binding response OmpR family regulator
MSQILVVDDDSDILRILTATLEWAGHSVRATLDPDEVQPLLAGQRFDLMILDVMMPRRSGWEILEELRSEPRTPRLPVVMLSAIGDAANRVRGLRLGADDFLAKPFNPEELIARIEGLLSAG